MFKRLIVVTDLSKDSNALINCLGGLKTFGTEECLLVQFQSSTDVLGIVTQYRAVILVESEKILKSQKETLEKHGYSVNTRVLSGYPINEINKIAVKEDYAAIVVGAQKYYSIDDVTFSTLANELIHVAQKPVLLIRLEENPEKVMPSYVGKIGCEIGNHVLFPTDFSENSDLAFTYIIKMAEEGAKKITLMHVQDESKMSPHLENRIEEFNDIDSARLLSMKDILQKKGKAEVDIVLKYGFPSVEILKAVDELKVQLVVMGSQGRGFIKEFFLGSVSHNVARRASSSVLLVPAKR